MLKKLDAKDIWVRKFEISESNKHKSGFTIYKVVSTVFPKSFPDGATKITVWKRYKDFKKLHKDLDGLFHHLYLKGKFPQLPKDKFFGRFDEAVIEERRKFALELLEFSAIHSQLFMNKVFVKFFEDGYSPNDFADGAGSNDAEKVPGNVLVEEEDTRFEECLVPEKVWEEKTAIDTNGVSPEEPSTSPSFSLSAQSSKPTTPTLEVAQLLLSDQTETTDIPSQMPSIVTFTDSSQLNECSSSKPTTSTYVPSPYSLQETKTLPYFGSSASLTEELDGFDEEFGVCNQNASRIQNSASSLSLNSLEPSTKKEAEKISAKKSHFGKYAGFNLFDFLPIFSKKQEKVVDDKSFIYVREAAGHFSVAHHHESNFEYSLALDAYTEGIKILLEGAQGDNDNQRRSLVRKKVEKYLANAELLKQKFNLGVSVFPKNNVSHQESRKLCMEGFVVVDNNVMPSSIVELQNYKVVGCTFNNLLIAVDTTSSGGPDCFAIKVLRKSPSPFDVGKPSLIPSAIPFMVQLVKWFNTEDAVVLILQFAAGGRLLNFVLQYQSKQISQLEPLELTDVKSEIVIGKDFSELGDTTRLEIGAGDCDIAFSESVLRLNTENEFSKLESVDSVQISKPEVMEAEVPTNILKTGSFDLQTVTLIENSKALLETVSKTLEQRKSFPISFFENIDGSKILEDCSNSVQGVTAESNSYFELSDTFTKLLRTNSNLNTDEEEDDKETLPIRMLPECCVKVWAAELIISLDRLHNQGITYGDFDIHNILLGDNGHILLTYRALWNEVDSRCEFNDFSSPEIRQSFGKAFWRSHPSVDWWSLGAILYFLFTGMKVQDTHPEGIHPQTIINVPATNLIGEPLSSLSISLLVELLQFTPNLRLGYYGAEEIKSHPFFFDFDWNAAENCGF